MTTVTITFANEITADAGNNAENSCAPTDPKLGADNTKIDMLSNNKHIYYAVVSVCFIAVQPT